MDAVSSSTGLQQNPAVRRRQMRQKVLNRIRKVNIKNKSLKSFYYFTYETAADAKRNQPAASTYFFNGEPCEGDEQFLRQMKRSVFVSNLAPGTKKSEIKQLFDRYGKVGAIQLKTRSGETIVGRQHISPYSPIVAIIKFSKKEEAVKACEASQDGKFAARLVEQTFQYEKENCIRVDNVETKITKAELWEHFKSFGVILNIMLETNDGSLILTDKEYEKQSFICCYVRFSRRSEAKAAKEMNGTLFRNRKLRLELAYQKHCDPNKLSNNVLRMFFQNVGDVIALDQIPHQHMGYVCYKNPLPAETMKRLNSRVYRNKRITFEKLDIGNLVKGQKQNKSTSGGNLDDADANVAAASSGVGADNNTSATAPTVKKAKMKSIQKKVGGSAGSGGGPSAGAGAGPGAAMKKKMPRKNVAAVSKAKSVEKMMKASLEEFV
uniref:RRM domain-containing protein n=1 Tax=Culex tarsalis TaxID=7177 RepID=A0A1Q3FW55_CULTA